MIKKEGEHNEPSRRTSDDMFMLLETETDGKLFTIERRKKKIKENKLQESVRNHIEHDRVGNATETSRT